MDLTTLQLKLDLRLYLSAKTFLQDLFLITDNCKFFNPLPSSYYTIAVDVETHVRAKVAELSSFAHTV